jgi:predicted RNase H-like HicB family nuclease
MINEYVNEALNKAKFEQIDNNKLYYGEVTELRGVWTTRKTLEECRHNLVEVIGGW